MDWKVFFNKTIRKNNLGNFLSPNSVIKVLNYAKVSYIYKRPFIISWNNDRYLITDGNFTRDLPDNSFFLLQYKNWRDKRLKINVTIEDEEFEFNSNDVIIFYFTNDEIFFFKNYNILKTYHYAEVRNATIKLERNQPILIDFIREPLEILDINTFSMLEGLMKKVLENNKDYKTFEDYNFIKYILNYKGDVIEKYLKVDKIEMLDTYDEFKGSYRDLQLIKNLNLFEKILFSDANTEYTNFINYFLNVGTEDYKDVIKAFMRNYNLYKQFKDKFKCIISPSERYVKAEWQKLRLGRCNFYNVNGKIFEGIVFPEENIDNRFVKLRIDDKYIENLKKRYIEIVNDVKGYLEYIDKIRTDDFRDVKLVIDNSSKAKIGNNTAFLIPGKVIDLSTQRLDGGNKECYLDYSIKINLDDVENINERLEFLKDVLDERMPYYLHKYLEYVILYTSSTFSPKDRMDESNFFDIQSDIEDTIPLERLDDDMTITFERRFNETYTRTDEDFGLALDAKIEPDNIKILGSGVYLDNGYDIMGYVTGEDGLLIKGGTSTKALPYENLRVGRYCFYIDEENNELDAVDVFVTKEEPVTERFNNRKDLVKCVPRSMFEEYQNNVIKFTNHYFEYVPGTKNVKTFEELDNLDLEPGLYSVLGYFKEFNYIEDEIKVLGEYTIINDEEYLIDLKEQTFKGKPENKIIARKLKIIS